VGEGGELESEDLVPVDVGTSNLTFLKDKKLYFNFEKLEKIYSCSQLFILQHGKKLCFNNSYFRLYKNDKRVDLVCVFLNLQILLNFIIFI
jgi:hypothetical protein